jgi:hypothetical protein
MRALTALLLVLAATVTVTACSGPSPAGNGRPRIAPLASPQTVGCDLAPPPAHLEQAAPTAARPWAYFAKWGIAIRAGSPAVLITVPQTWRHRAGISWGNNLGVVSSLRLLSCPRQPGAWNVYAGGFYLRSPSGCVPLAFHVGRQTATLSFAIGSGNCAARAP